jgi:hypothetical protein
VARIRHEALSGETELGHEPVAEVAQAAGQPQRQPGAFGLQPGDYHRARTTQTVLDSLQPVGARLDLIGGRVQDAPEECLVVRAGVTHASRSSNVRRVVMALAV